MVDTGSFLAGRRVLVVEDEYLLATELAAILVKHGAQVLGPTPSVARTRRLLDFVDKPDAALLDVNLGGELVWPVAELLQRAGVPIVLTTGYDVGAIPARFALLPCCDKPTGSDEVLAALRRVLDQTVLDRSPP